METSVVIHLVDIERNLALELEGDPPIAADHESPCAIFLVPCSLWMSRPGRPRWGIRGVESVQGEPYARSVPGLDASERSDGEEPFDFLVPGTL